MATPKSAAKPSGKVASFEYQEPVESPAGSFSHLAGDSPIMRYNDFDEPSKMDKLLGNGKVADILLWRDEKKTFSCFLFLFLLYHSFFIAGRTFISSVASLLLLIIMFLCGHRVLPLSICGFTIPRLSSSCFEISEVDVRNSFLAMKGMWNGLGHLTKTLAEGEDWYTFLKVLAFLYFCKLIILNSMSVAIGTALVLPFTLCFIYEQYEEEIDGVATVILSNCRKPMFVLMKNLPTPLASVFSGFKLWLEKGSSSG